MEKGLPLIDVPVPHDGRVGRLVAAFREQFGRDPEGIAEAPGRVNLIGEHVDYNDGLVLPVAIDRSVMCAWTGREGGLTWPKGYVRDIEHRSKAAKGPLKVLLTEISAGMTNDATEVLAYSVDYDGFVAFKQKNLNAPGRFHDDVSETDLYDPADAFWVDYIEGVAWAFLESEHPIERAMMVLAGDVSAGAGVSSSAALEVCVAGAFREAFDLNLSDADLALLCQRAENEYVGVQCGIMDQFASALSKAGHALLIDCRTLAYKHVPLRLAENGLATVIANSAVRRELITSAYNERRRECEEAVSLLRDVLARPALHSLRDVRAAELDELFVADEGRGKRRPYAEDVVLRRARHVVGEIERVAEAVDALERDDFVRLGELMAASHASLRDDYEVSSEQLDLLVGLASAQEYVLGARLTGAGFGGCTVNLVRADRVEDFARDVIAPYREQTGLPAVMYMTEPCDGLRTWRL